MLGDDGWRISNLDGFCGPKCFSEGRFRGQVHWIRDFLEFIRYLSPGKGHALALLLSILIAGECCVVYLHACILISCDRCCTLSSILGRHHMKPSWTQCYVSCCFWHYIFRHILVKLYVFVVHCVIANDLMFELCCATGLCVVTMVIHVFFVSQCCWRESLQRRVAEMIGGNAFKRFASKKRHPETSSRNALDHFLKELVPKSGATDHLTIFINNLLWLLHVSSYISRFACELMSRTVVLTY